MSTTPTRKKNKSGEDFNVKREKIIDYLNVKSPENLVEIGNVIKILQTYSNEISSGRIRQILDTYNEAWLTHAELIKHPFNIIFVGFIDGKPSRRALFEHMNPLSQGDIEELFLTFGNPEKNISGKNEKLSSLILHICGKKTSTPLLFQSIHSFYDEKCSRKDWYNLYQNGTTNPMPLNEFLSKPISEIIDPIWKGFEMMYPAGWKRIEYHQDTKDDSMKQLKHINKDLMTNDEINTIYSSLDALFRVDMFGNVINLFNFAGLTSWNGDHIFPVARGGLCHPNNLALIHSKANHNKSDTPWQLVPPEQLLTFSEENFLKYLRKYNVYVLLGTIPEELSIESSKKERIALEKTLSNFKQEKEVMDKELKATETLLSNPSTIVQNLTSQLNLIQKIVETLQHEISNLKDQSTNLKTQKSEIKLTGIDKNTKEELKKLKIDLEGQLEKIKVETDDKKSQIKINQDKITEIKAKITQNTKSDEISILKEKFVLDTSAIKKLDKKIERETSNLDALKKRIQNHDSMITNMRIVYEFYQLK